MSIKEVSRVSGVDAGGNEAFIVVKNSGSPFPHPTIVPFAVLTRARCSSIMCLLDQPHLAQRKRSNSRNRVPVAETDVRTALIARVELVEEQAELGLCREAAAFDLGVRREVVAGGDDRPVVRDLHRDGAVQGAYLDNG